MANIKRQRRTVLTEENLKKFLSIETLKLNLDHHNWLKDSFLAKIGGLAPNLKDLCLRRLPISNASFTELVHKLHHLEKLDVSDCSLIEESGMKELFKNNGESLKYLNASNCIDAVTDETLSALCAIEEPVLEHLDISYCK
jgi:hypothetical protein